MQSFSKRLLGGAALVFVTARAFAQVPVIDSATLSQATTTASNTASIMATNQQILTATNATLAAVTGNRTTGSMSTAAIGSGFSVASAPSFGSLLGGTSMSWGSLGSYGSTAATIINGLNLVATLSGNATAATGTDQAYMGAVNTSAALTGVVQGAQAAATTRASSLQGASALVGTRAGHQGVDRPKLADADPDGADRQRGHWRGERRQCRVERANATDARCSGEDGSGFYVALNRRGGPKKQREPWNACHSYCGCRGCVSGVIGVCASGPDGAMQRAIERNIRLAAVWKRVGLRRITSDQWADCERGR